MTPGLFRGSVSAWRGHFRQHAVIVDEVLFSLGSIIVARSPPEGARPSGLPLARAAAPAQGRQDGDPREGLAGPDTVALRSDRSPAEQIPPGFGPFDSIKMSSTGRATPVRPPWRLRLLRFRYAGFMGGLAKGAGGGSSVQNAPQGPGAGTAASTCASTKSEEAAKTPVKRMPPASRVKQLFR